MTNLLKAECLRLISRRLTWILLGLVLIAGAVVAISFSAQTRPLDAADWQDARAELAMASTSWEESCGDPGTECEGDSGWELEDFLRRPITYEDAAGQALLGGMLVLIAGTVLASAMVGGEFTSGSLSTQLTFTPRRIHVMAGKVAAATAGGVALMFAYVTTVMVVGTIAFLMVRGASDVQAGPELPLMIVRLLVAAFFLALLSSSLTFGLGSTGLTMAAGALLVIGTSGVWTSLGAIPELVLKLMPWQNLVTLVEGRQTVTIWPAVGPAREVVITYWWALGYAAGLVALVATASAVVFRRRNLVR